jgi:uncharacterized membrane protein YsdA (DUF1294 family)
MSETLFLVAQTVFSILDFCLFCCAVVGNSLVIYVITFDKKLKSKSNFHVRSVALADLLIALLGIPLGVVAVSLEFHLTLTFADFVVARPLRGCPTLSIYAWR